MLFSFLILSTGSAATLRVGSTEAFATISAAVEASVDGDRIEVAAGTYNEQVTLNGKSVTLVGVEGPGETSIITEGQTAIRLDHGEGTESVISGFTVQSAGHTCVYIAGSSPRIENLVLLACGGSTGVNGGGIQVSSASPTIYGTEFRSNQAELGGGVFVGAGSTVDFDACTFTGNQAQTGGALAVSNSTVTVSNTNFVGNRADTGGGVAITDSIMTIENSQFIANEAPFGAAGALLVVRSDLVVNNTDFEGNEATYNGGALLSEGGTIALDGVRFTENGALFGEGGAIRSYENTSISASSSEFSGNIAAQNGGALAGSNIGSINLVDTEFRNNRTEIVGGGGAVFVEYSGLTMTDGTAEGNEAPEGGVFRTIGSDIVISRSTFDRNESLGTGGAIYTEGGSLRVDATTFESNQAYGDAGAVYSSAIETSITDSLLHLNESSGGDGGALFLAGRTTDLIQNSLRGNWARAGGAIYADRAPTDVDGSVSIKLSTIQENEALYTAGGLHTSGPVHIVAHNNTFLGNASLSAGTAANLRIESPDSDFRNNIIAWGVTGVGVSMTEEASSTALFRHNNVFENEENYAGFVPADDDGNLSADPSFVEYSLDGDFTNDDLYLWPHSPCIGAGDPDLFGTGDWAEDIGALGETSSTPTDEDGDGYSPDFGEDCDDSTPSTHTGAEEICDDGVDNDCNAEVDEGCEPADTGEPMDPPDEDSGIESIDTGAPPEQDTGAPPASDTGSDEPQDDRLDTAPPSSEESNLYALNGKGCSCSTTIRKPAALWWCLLPLILIRRRPT